VLGECNVRAADARISILWHDDKFVGEGQARKQPFNQLLEGWRQSRLRNLWICAAKVSNATRVGLEQFDGHPS